MILFMRLVDITTSSNTGLLPPAKPVFPPCGHTAKWCSLQYFNIAETSSVVLGFRTHWLLPRKTKDFKYKNSNQVKGGIQFCTKQRGYGYKPLTDRSQSTLYASTSDTSVNIRVLPTIPSKTLISLSVSEPKFPLLTL